MRKHVKPADPLAAIPDPAHGGDLPSGGLDVEWGVHWARLEMRGDIIVSEVDAGAVAAPGEIGSEAAGGTVASVPFMITAAMRRRLRALGKTDDEISQMKPEEAQALLPAADATSA